MPYTPDTSSCYNRRCVAMIQTASELNRGFIERLVCLCGHTDRSMPWRPNLSSLSRRIHHLLSLLRQHQHHRPLSTQIHAHLITTHSHPLLLYNALIRHYALGRFPHHAILLYKHTPLIHPLADTFTFAFLIKASPTPRHAGFQFHALTIRKGFHSDLFVHTALVDMYATSGSLLHACDVFDQMPHRNSVTWNALITGSLRWGDVTLATALFNRMPARDVISWTVMIDGYTRNRCPPKALLMFRRMVDAGIQPTEITILALIPAISNLAELGIAELLHGYCRKRGLDVVDVRVQNSLIDMYAKCGSVENSLKVFEDMGGSRNLVSWTSVISGFAMHGMAGEAVRLFEEMGRANVAPNRVTFLSVLHACSHAGLVEEGMGFFTRMVYDCGVEPDVKHYGCMIDMLGRAGRLREAEEMIAGMPVEVNVVVWRTLLGCCSKHGEVEMGERVMKRILELERGHGGDYVVLSNMLTGVGRFGDAARVRVLMDERNLVKVPGLSLIDQKE